MEQTQRDRAEADDADGIVTGFDELVARFAALDAAELARWVENRWVLPEREGEGFLFREVDVARVELILEIRHGYAIDDEATGLVLGLLDQVYNLRRQMRRLCQALEAQPQDVKEAIHRALPPAGPSAKPSGSAPSRRARSRPR